MKLSSVIFLIILSKISCEEIFQELVSANNKFAADVYRVFQQLDKRDNFMFSPFSAETVVAFIQSGARNQTALELSQAGHLPDRNNVQTAFKNLLPVLKPENRSYSFYSANKLYLKKKFTVKKEFGRVAGEVFDASVESVDFSNSVEAAKLMNAWVEQKTQKKIKNLFDPDSLDSDTTAVILNALYFKANFSIPFTKVLTRKKNFYLLEGGKIEVDTMWMLEENSKYFENFELKAKFFQLPFREDFEEDDTPSDFSMVVVLPDENFGISQLEEKIDQVFTPQEFNNQHLHVEMPKFKIESKLDFKKILQKLGVTAAFTPGEADFSGIGDLRLFVDQAVQKTAIDVNEEGVEAAGASYFSVVDKIAGGSRIKQFIVNHPFIFYIKYRDLILFAGRVAVPKY